MSKKNAGDGGQLTENKKSAGNMAWMYSSPTTAQKSNPIHPAHAQPPPLPVTSDYCNRCKGRHFPRPFLLTPTCSTLQGGTVHNHQQFKWLGITLDTIRTCQRALIPTLLPPACTLLTVAPNPAVLSSPINMPRGTGSSRLKGLSRSILSHSLRGRQRQTHVLPAGKQSQRLEAAASSRRAQFQEMSAEDRKMVESMMVDYVNIITLSQLMCRKRLRSKHCKIGSGAEWVVKGGIGSGTGWVVEVFQCVIPMSHMSKSPLELWEGARGLAKVDEWDAVGPSHYHNLVAFDNITEVVNPLHVAPGLRPVLISAYVHS
ncbi:hypothetical protein EV702DRAFT_1043929, partial [Suillus placidus]